MAMGWLSPSPLIVGRSSGAGAPQSSPRAVLGCPQQGSAPGTHGGLEDGTRHCSRVPAPPASGTSPCNPASWKHPELQASTQCLQEAHGRAKHDGRCVQTTPELPNSASGNTTAAVHTVAPARACPQRCRCTPSPCCIPYKKLSAATCAHPVGSGHHTKGSAPTTTSSAAQEPPPKPLPRSQTWSRPQAAQNHISHPSQLGGLGGGRAGAGMPPGLLQKVFSTVLVPTQVSMPQASTVSLVTLRYEAPVSPPHKDARRLPRGPTGRTEAAKPWAGAGPPGEPQAWRWLHAGKGWRVEVMGHAAEGSDAGE